MPAQNHLCGALVAAFIFTVSFSKAATVPVQNAYIGAVIEQHNLHRANHSAPDLLWDSSLASIAQKHAQLCDFEHTQNSPYGENLASAGASGTTDAGKLNAVRGAITNQWYNGEVNSFVPYYGQANPGGNFGDYGHFTQVVWAATTKVGCGTMLCKAGTIAADYSSWYTVCNYDPAGNLEGAYAENVYPSLGEPTEVVPDA